MKFRKFLVANRLILGILLLILAVFVTIKVNVWAALIIYILGILVILAHFLIGPITLIQKMIEAGDIEGSQKMLNGVKYPNLLYKPIRSAFYMLQSNFATMNQDFDKAESDIRKSIASSGSALDKNSGGAAYLQLGMIAFKKGNTKEAFENLRKAISEGLPDKETEATAYLQLSSLSIQRRDFKAGKNYFRKVKSLNPQTPELKEQIKEMEKYISRIPG